jgi:hypothetical protein
MLTKSEIIVLSIVTLALFGKIYYQKAEAADYCIAKEIK